MTTKLVQRCCFSGRPVRSALSGAPPGEWLEVSSACSLDRSVALKDERLRQIMIILKVTVRNR
jgi:hypothetical protein